MPDIVEPRNIDLDLFQPPTEPWEARVPEAPPAKPRIQLPGKDRLVGTFAIDLGQNLRNAQIYQKDGKIVVQKARSMEFGAMKPGKFVTWIEKFVECYEGCPSADGSGTPLLSLPSGVAARVLESDQFLNELPTVKSCNQIRQPVFDQDGRLVLLPTGYDQRTQTLTARGSLQYPLAMKLDDARAYLNRLLGEFCFANVDQGKAVQVAAMVTAYGMSLLSDTCIIPAFVYTANESGAGKGLCVNLALVPVLGVEPAAATVKTQDEMGKWLFAAVRAGEKFLFLDNLDIPLADPWLEKFMTSSRINARVLGGSDNETHAKKAALFITGNRLTMRADMRRRCLVVEFFLPQARAEARQIENPLDVQGIIRERHQILGSLHAMIREWAEHGKPAPSKTHPSFMEWSNVVGGIVEYAGFGCPIPCLDVAPDVDPETADMERLVEQMHAADKPFGLTFSQVVTLCQEHGLFEGRLPTKTAERRGNTEFGRVLKRFQDREFPNQLIFRVYGNGHGRKYAVQGATAVTEGAPATAPVPEPEPVATVEPTPEPLRSPELLPEPQAA